MPALKVYGVSTGIFGKLRMKMAELPENLKKEVVLVHISSDAREADGRNAPYLEVHCSRETDLEEVIVIANHFVAHIDVEAYDPRNGQFVFRESLRTKPDGMFTREDFAE